MVHYSPVSYYTLGAVYPRERLRRPWPRWAFRSYGLLDYETIVIYIPGTDFYKLEGSSTTFELIEGASIVSTKLDGVDVAFTVTYGPDPTFYKVVTDNE